MGLVNIEVSDDHTIQSKRCRVVIMVSQGPLTLETASLPGENRGDERQ